MATATICDKCNKVLKFADSQVKIEYVMNVEGRLVPKRKIINLCAECYKEIFGEQLEQFVEDLNNE